MAQKKPAKFHNVAGPFFMKKLFLDCIGKDMENGRISQPARKTNIIVYEFRNSWQRY